VPFALFAGPSGRAVSAGVTILAAPAAGVALAGVVIAGAAVAGAVVGTSKAADAVAARQQRRIETRARIERATTDYNALLHRVETARERHGDAVSPLPPLPAGVLTTARPADAHAALATIAAALDAGERRLRDELARARTARLVASLAAVGAVGAGGPFPGVPPAAATAPASGRVGGGGPSAGPPVGPPVVPDDLADSVRRVFGRLDSAVAASVQAELDGRARQVLLARPGEAERLLDDLRFGVQRANDDLAARRARLADLHERLDRFAGEAVVAVRRRLYDAADDPDPDWGALEAAVNAAIDHAVAQAVRAYTAQALRESLEEVGCEVEEGFDVLLVANGFAHLRRPGWDDLAIRVRAGDGDGVLRFNAVAPRDGDGRMDEATEHGWCATFDELLARLAEAGVPIEVTERSEIGDAHVQRVDPSRFPFARADVEAEVDVEAEAEIQAGRRRGRDRRDAREPRRHLPPPR
jgi:hypothetical protein